MSRYAALRRTVVSPQLLLIATTDPFLGLVAQFSMTNHEKTDVILEDGYFSASRNRFRTLHHIAANTREARFDVLSQYYWEDSPLTLSPQQTQPLAVLLQAKKAIKDLELKFHVTSSRPGLFWCRPLTIDMVGLEAQTQE